ncbi:unnamed protein product [Rhizoctonia solani]|uniref:Uncharacterized protein n=1 Tax=Rhizoctonia solani TaxID=456999 RepID=A0A8H3HCH8_9AGAM|nr:unnamed protein product [Rhizoctonia solani]
MSQNAGWGVGRGAPAKLNPPVPVCILEQSEDRWVTMSTLRMRQWIKVPQLADRKVKVLLNKFSWRVSI